MMDLPEIRSGIPRSVRLQIGGVCLAFLAGIGALAWYGVDHEAPAVGVVIITLDTTRADRLSPYGFMDAAMPHLDRLAREGVVFDQATSVAPLTLPAHTSLFTGLFPPAHGVRDNADPPLSSEHLTLAEILRGQRFRTGAFVGSVVLDADRGLSHGFDEYRGVATTAALGRVSGPPRRRRGDQVVTDAIRWIEGVQDSRFFVWAHLYDPHRPYDPPEPFRSKYTDPYIAEIAFADAQIGRLLDSLERRNLLDRTIVIVAADHGESLGDHGERDHGIFVYESVLRVPLIMRVPGVAPRRVADVVRLVDVMPTVLDLLGVAPPPVNGVSLVAALHGKPQEPELEAYAESQYPLRFGWSPLRALRAGRYKLIDAPRPELYDLERDPFEKRNLYEERGDVARAFSQRLRMLDGSVVSPHRKQGSDPIAGSDLEQRLTSLGYVGSGPSTDPASRPPLPDPKDCIAVSKSKSPTPTCINVRQGSWPVPIGQLFVKGPAGSTR
jgi:choline-sulfatase